MLRVPEAEYRAARESELRAEVTLSALRLAGPDRKNFLSGLVTADVQRLAAGDWTPAYLLTPKGRLVVELAAYDRGEDLLLLGRGTKPLGLLQAGLGKSIVLSESRLEPFAGGAYRAWAWAGPRAGERFSGIAGCAEAGGGGRWICRSRFWGPCWLELVPGPAEPPIPAPAAFEALRVEAGVAAEQDVDADAFPLELSEEGISFDKGCYLGQETTAKMKHLGHSNRRLSRIRLAGPVDDAAELRLGEERVGRATSVVEVPGRGILALSLLKLPAASPGTRLAAGTTVAEVLA